MSIANFQSKEKQREAKYGYFPARLSLGRVNQYQNEKDVWDHAVSTFRQY